MNGRDVETSRRHERAQKILDQYGRLLSVPMAAGLAMMVVLVFTNVVLRYVFN